MVFSVKETLNCTSSLVKNSSDSSQFESDFETKNFNSCKNSKKRGRGENHGLYKDINRKKGRCDSTSEIITSSPDHDGYQWRKYGEKKIMNNQFPRCYYRCTYSRESNCTATKQVQQQNYSDPATYKVTYFSDHSCTKSTAHRDPKPINNSQFLLDFSAKSTPSPSSSPPVGSSPVLSSATEYQSSCSDNEQERPVSRVGSDGLDQLGSMWSDSYGLDWMFNSEFGLKNEQEFFASLFELNHVECQQPFLKNNSECFLFG